MEDQGPTNHSSGFATWGKQ